MFKKGWWGGGILWAQISVRSPHFVPGKIVFISGAQKRRCVTFLYFPMLSAGWQSVMSCWNKLTCTDVEIALLFVQTGSCSTQIRRQWTFPPSLAYFDLKHVRSETGEDFTRTMSDRHNQWASGWWHRAASPNCCLFRFPFELLRLGNGDSKELCNGERETAICVFWGFQNASLSITGGRKKKIMEEFVVETKMLLKEEGNDQIWKRFNPQKPA